MVIKEYKRIPILKETKKRLVIAKTNSVYSTFDEFINYLLYNDATKDMVYNFRRFEMPSNVIHLSEQDGKTLISVDGITWRDITGILTDLKPSK